MDESIKKQIDKIEPDVQDYIFNRGFKSGQEHSHPSPETIRRIEELKKDNDNMSKMIKEIHDFIFGVEGVGGLNKTVDRIDLHTQKTNGRVTRLEYWRWMVAGAITIIMIIGVPMMWRQMDRIDRIDQQITSHVGISK